MKKSIQQIVLEHDRVLATRKRLEKMFSMIANCHVTIGGSYMLTYWCEAFSDRVVSDYDFILYALPEDMAKIKTFIDLLNRQTVCFGELKYYDNISIYCGFCNGKRANVILKPVEKYCPCTNYETLEDIIAVKRAWCEKAIKQGKKPRYKDVLDISVYEDWLKEEDLPF